MGAGDGDEERSSLQTDRLLTEPNFGREMTETEWCDSRTSHWHGAKDHERRAISSRMLTILRLDFPNTRNRSPSTRSCRFPERQWRTTRYVPFRAGVIRVLTFLSARSRSHRHPDHRNGANRHAENHHPSRCRTSHLYRNRANDGLHGRRQRHLHW